MSSYARYFFIEVYREVLKYLTKRMARKKITPKIANMGNPSSSIKPVSGNSDVVGVWVNPVEVSEAVSVVEPEDDAVD